MRAAATILILALTQASPPGVAAQAGGGDLPTYAYALSGGDRVRVTIYGEQNLGGEFTIGGSGRISLPLIGEVDTRGLTSTQLQDRIAARLADGYVKDPRVAVEVLTTRPFYILGEVNKPGQYPFANGMTVETAVAQAGGFTYRAKTRKVLVKHAGQPDEAAAVVDAGAPIAPGDTIRVRERWF